MSNSAKQFVSRDMNYELYYHLVKEGVSKDLAHQLSCTLTAPSNINIEEDVDVTRSPLNDSFGDDIVGLKCEMAELKGELTILKRVLFGCVLTVISLILKNAFLEILPVL